MVPGAEVDGELPTLTAGAHSISIALVDETSSGALLGPRARVQFTVGAAPEPPEIIIEAPAAQLSRRASPEIATTAYVRVTQLQTLEGAGWSGKVAINGIDITSGAVWHPYGGNDGIGGVEWRSHLGQLPDGLHVLDAELRDPSGASFSRDRRYFELLTSNASHPRGGIEYAADSEDCCDALEGGRDFVAPPVAETVMHQAFTDPDAQFVTRDAADMLNEWCQVCCMSE